MELTWRKPKVNGVLVIKIVIGVSKKLRKILAVYLEIHRIIKGTHIDIEGVEIIPWTGYSVAKG